ncbi:TPA: DUF3168 domain-containing protein [Listeria monocytogenes]|uniref:DUF3168 domain-containing protein n=2 Tax=root TaxID=1 RepID=A0A059T681_9CAUD|nr:hypothetical protein [Listeria monocytogenes]YP_009044811.1 hypothetical protein LP101_010 [Listeria phage LP-101]EAE3727999.1 DUF3168 domain-containing protein [Listeria monocytogenes serotype 1/2b]EAF4506154.1 DUF3168 domain-containing protein [Listeria monocytogenes serotype 1/2a]AHL18789.1 hypothetical protein LP101_010 [Listeria phage LP-101]AQP56129.1 DUF3168 domain-containing protein [Listeria monocytogenes]EAA0042790.1 DUF3168 domain-containing protein [Listeria monocytogenes]
MIDILNIIYTTLSKNDIIHTTCEERIKYYDFPSTGNSNKTFLLIIPLDVPVPTNFSSNEAMWEDFLVQIDVQSDDRLTVKQIQEEVRKEMKQIGFGQLAGGLDEYFPETGRFVDARKYSGLPYKLYQ